MPALMGASRQRLPWNPGQFSQVPSTLFRIMWNVQHSPRPTPRFPEKNFRTSHYEAKSGFIEKNNQA